MTNVHLVCEGPADGLDVRVLNLLVAQSHNVAVRISAAGGDRSLGSVAEWLEENSRRPQTDGSLGARRDTAICIEDRNFHPRSRSEDLRANANGKRLVWLRHEIENYLLEPRVVFAAFQSFRQTVLRPWTQSLPNDETQVAALLSSLAQPLLEDHAGNVLLRELRERKGECGSTDLGSLPPRPSSGTGYPGREEWLKALHDEVGRLRTTFADIGNLPAFQPQAFERRYDAILSELRLPAFFQNGDYLIDLGGKEILQSLERHLHNLGAQRLSTELLENELLAAIGRSYRPGTLFQPDEFQLLAIRLNQFGGTGSVSRPNP